MAAFQSPIDIWNRGLDHCGGRAVTGAADGSRNALKCAEVYDKIRQAELRGNMWVFSTRKAAIRPIDITTMQLVPPAYNVETQYYVGDIISYASGFWIALQRTLGGVPPVDANGTTSPSWDNYYGPLTADVWQAPNSTSPLPNGATTYPGAYHAGEIVYLAPGNGTFSAFLSLVDDNTDDPLGPDAFSLTVNYNIGQVVLGSNNTLYQSTVSFNLGNDPTIVVPAGAYASGTTYAAGAYVYDSTNQIYQSLVSSNTGNTPASSPSDWLATGTWTGTWTTVLTPQPRATSNNWHFLTCTLQPLSIVFPVGSGPASQTWNSNLYRLPNNFLMRAPAERQLGNKVSWLGASGPPPEDYVFQGPYLISRCWGAIILRFISDFQNVAGMDPLFCESMAAKMGYELCETLTQKPDLKAACRTAYTDAVGMARTVNAIEVGAIEQVEDEYIRVRY